MARTARRKTKRKAPRKGKLTLAQIYKKAAKEKRPTRFSYDRDGNIVGVYVPMQHKTKAEQKAASRAMVSACSAGAYRQGVSPTKTCGYRGIKPSKQAARGLAYARWGFPKGWPKPRKVKNPGYNVGSMQVKTFMDEDGDWGYVVYDVGGAPLLIDTGEPSEKIAAREGKAEARFQAEILAVEGREMRAENPWVGPDGHTVVTPPPEILEDICEKGQLGGPLAHWKISDCRQPQHRCNPGRGLHLIKFPASTWGFVGSVPSNLTYVTKEGKRPTAEQFETARSFGPRLAGVKTRSWKTKAAALRAAKAEGYDPEKVKGHGLIPRSSPKSKTKNPKGTKRATNVRSLVSKALK